MITMRQSSVLKYICNRGILLALFGLVALNTPAYSADDYPELRARLVKEISRDVIATLGGVSAVEGA